MKITRPVVLATILFCCNSASALEINPQIDLDMKLEVEYVNSPYRFDLQNQFSPGTFQLGKLSLRPKYTPTEWLKLKADFRFGNSDTKIRRAYFTIALPNSELTIGKNDPFIKMDRETNIRPLPGAVFWANRHIGAQYRYNLAPFYAIASISNGTELKSDTVSVHDIFDAAVDDELVKDTNENKMLGLALGIKLPVGPLKTNLRGYAYRQKVAEADSSYLDAFPDANRGDQIYRLFGAGATVKLLNTKLQAQYIWNKVGTMKRSAWSVGPSYEFSFGMKYLQSVTAIANWSVLTNGMKDQVQIPETWDRKTGTFALLFQIHKSFMTLLEYNIHRENTGSGAADNDGYLAQLRISI